MFTTPICVIIYNRIDAVRRLMAALASVEPTHVLIVADGPRPGCADDRGRVSAARAVCESISWDCDIQRDCAHTNLGCRERVVSGLDWAFSKVERAIILEDDCLPRPGFFRFAEELLDRYRNDERVMSVCGSNHFPACIPEGQSYSFSKYHNCWGWATWADAWRRCDADLSTLSSSIEQGLLRQRLGSLRAALYWQHILRQVQNGQIDSWAYIWSYSCMIQGGLHILPRVNLIRNTGFGADSTHTSARPGYVRGSEAGDIQFPLRHPEAVRSNKALDRMIEDSVFSKSLVNRVKWLWQKVVR